MLINFPFCSLTPFDLMQDFCVLLLSTPHSTQEYLASRKGKAESIQIIFLMLFHCLWDWVKDLLWFEHCRLKTKAGTTGSLQLTGSALILMQRRHTASTLRLLGLRLFFCPVLLGFKRLSWQQVLNFLRKV